VIARLSLALAASALLAGVLVAQVPGKPRSAATGSPDRGRLVYFGAGGCSNCHAESADPSQPSTGPQLTLETLRAHASAAGKPLADYVAESILVPSAYVVPGYVSGMMQPPANLSRQQVEDLVSYLIGKPWTSPAGGGLKLPARPVAACTADATCRRTVAGWVKAEKLPLSALRGAKIVAVSGCLSCHRYAGGGTRSGSAPDLTSIGRQGLSVGGLVTRLRTPRSGSVMPSYRAYGDANLRLIAAFLRASRGTR
jgi:mono/diheme cytochrome c family protein